MKLLIVVDMQNYFIDAALGTKEAVAIVPAVAEKIAEYREAGNQVIFTRDTHQKNYMETQEGKNLPVMHCIEGTDGWQISKELEVGDSKIFNKPSFGSMELADYVASLNDIEEIELIGLCTGICVISNAFILKAKLPEVKITVDSSCCACVTPSSMIVPIEWVGVTEENYGKNISAEFLKIEHSYTYYSIKRKFKIGKTKNLILPHSRFIFDPDSVKPENIQLKLDNPEFVFEINHDVYPLDYSQCKITFMVSEK